MRTAAQVGITFQDRTQPKALLNAGCASFQLPSRSASAPILIQPFGIIGIEFGNALESFQTGPFSPNWEYATPNML